MDINVYDNDTSAAENGNSIILNDGTNFKVIIMMMMI